MFCPNCGAQSDTGKFCRNCGTNLARVSQVILEPGQKSATGSETTTLGLFFNASVSNRYRPMQGHNAGAIFGSVTVDLTAERLAVGETKFSLFSVFGSAEVFVDDDVGIRVTGFTCFAGASVRGKELGNGFFATCDYVSDNYDRASRRVHIEASAVFAGVTIKRRD
jgi:predicted membrane protein